MKIQDLLIKIYGIAKASGFLNLKPIKSLFWISYCFYKEFFEDDLRTWGQRYPDLFKGGDIFDVGANIGYTTKVLLKLKDPGSKVYSFEPEDWNFDFLTSNIGNSNNVELIKKAVGGESRNGFLWINSRHHADHRVVEGFGSSSKDQPIEIVSIDDYLAAISSGSTVTFIKIDVQGFELNVCMGMRRTIESNPKISVFVEIVPSTDSEKIFTFFQKLGLKGYFILKDRTMPLKETDIIEAAGSKGYIDVLFTRQMLA